MRYALFDNEQDAVAFAQVIQGLCDQHNDPSKPKIIKMAAYIDWLGKYAVSMEISPAYIPTDEIVDSVERPQEPEIQ